MSANSIKTKQKNVSHTPELRFRKFNDVFTEKELGDLTSITRLAGYEYSEYWKEDQNKEIIALRGYNIGKGKLNLRDLGYISNDLSLKLQRSRLSKGDVVYPCVGSIGNAVVIEDDNKYHIQQNIAKITCGTDLSPYFLVQFLISHCGVREVNRFNASGAQANVLVGSLRKFRLHIPSLPEQQKIADFLGSVDTWLDNLRQQKTTLENYKRGMMQKLFTQQIRFKDDSGNEFPDWQEKELGSVCRIRTGKKDVNQGNPNGVYPFFTCAKQHTYSDAFSFDCDAILIAGNGEVGHSQKYSGRFEAYQRTYVLSDFKVSYNYMWTVIKTLFEDYVTNQTQTGAMPYIKLGTLKSFSVPLPTEQEQEKVANLLSALDELITAKAEEIAKAEQWKKGLMQKMFV